MRDYSKGKIYAIRSYITTDVYYGSTIETLARRLIQHKSYYKKWLSNKERGKFSSFIILEKDSDCYIELVEDYPCNNRNELQKREGQIIRGNTCINKNIAGRTSKEYHEDNKEQLLEKYKQYYQYNKQTILEKTKQYRTLNKEKIAEHKKQYRQNNKEQILEYRKHYQQNNKEKLAEQKKQYAYTNKEQLIQYKKQYYQNNKELISKRRKVKYTCECGLTLTLSGKSKHEQSKKHRTFINIPTQ